MKIKLILLTVLCLIVPVVAQDVTTEKTATDVAKEENPEEKQIKFIKDTIMFGIQDERRDAMNRILQIKDEKGRAELNDILIELLETELNSEAKMRALTIIGQLNLGKGIEQIEKLLDDRSEEIRAAAVNTLNTLNAVSTAPKLIELLKELPTDKDSLYHEALITAIGNFKSKDMVEFAQTTIDNNRTIANLRERFLLYLVRLDDPELGEYFLKMAKNEDEEVNMRAYAINGLWRIGNAEYTGAIKEILTEIDSYPLNRRRRFNTLSIYAVTALVKLGDTDATPRLMDALRDNNASTRIRAVQLLKELQDKRTIDILKYKMNHDQNDRVRRISREALIEMGEIEKDNADN